MFRGGPVDTAAPCATGAITERGATAWRAARSTDQEPSRGGPETPSGDPVPTCQLSSSRPWPRARGAAAAAAASASASWCGGRVRRAEAPARMRRAEAPAARVECSIPKCWSCAVQIRPPRPRPPRPPAPVRRCAASARLSASLSGAGGGGLFRSLALHRQRVGWSWGGRAGEGRGAHCSVREATS